MSLFLTGWRGVFQDGPREGEKVALEVPWPTLETPEGTYKRVERDDRRRVATYRKTRAEQGATDVH